MSHKFSLYTQCFRYLCKVFLMEFTYHIIEQGYLSKLSHLKLCVSPYQFLFTPAPDIGSGWNGLYFQFQIMLNDTRFFVVFFVYSQVEFAHKIIS